MSDSRFHAAVLEKVGIVVGKYTITEPLSAGGMGAVFRATHTLLGRNAAVKLLRPDLSDNRELVARFFNEAKAASAIHHPGIVEVFDFGFSEDGEAYLVMELLDGESLGARIAAKRRLTEVHAGMIARGIAGALGAAHAKNIVHRDLKPDNVFLVPDPDVPFGERPKVLDFGIAKLTESITGTRSGHTRTGALIGTPQYMAPEQAEAATAVDHRADLYSLGCILYEMLVGQPPFVAEGAGEVIALQMFAEPTRVSQRLTAISPAIEAITMRLLAKAPADRFQSAAEVVDALDATVGRLSGERATTIASASAPRITVSYTPRPDASQAGVSGPMPGAPVMMAERPSEIAAPARRGSGLAVIAGALVIAIATVAVAVVVTQHGDARAPAVTPAETITTTTTPPPLPPPTQPPSPPPPQPPVQPVTPPHQPVKVVARVPVPPPKQPVATTSTTPPTAATGSDACKVIVDGKVFDKCI